MRANTRRAFEAWAIGKSYKGSSSVTTDGTTIFSYATPIVTRVGVKGEGEVVVVNMTGYSVTTTQDQNALRVLCEQTYGDTVEIVDNAAELYRGVSRDRLVSRAMEQRAERLLGETMNTIRANVEAGRPLYEGVLA